MELYFFRHGDAEPASAAPTDEARRLTPRGRRETLAVAQALHRAGLRPQAIITSPLARASQTGDILQEVFDLPSSVDERLRSGCTLGAAQGLVSDHPYEQIILVGHEPDFSAIVGQLTGDARVQLSKSGLARVDADRIEPDQGTLVWLLAPELFLPQ